jgi:two-component system response regulator FixJ
MTKLNESFIAQQGLTEREVAIVENAIDRAIEKIRADRAHNIELLVTPLTERERQVLVGLMAGETNREVAQQLTISPRTVEVHRASIMDKFGARNTVHLVSLVRDAWAKAGYSPSWDK